ncbi:MAG: hypothetical protein GKR92_11185 [Gammaproteobacteria bacterium]|nr:MAG: hypothetical protein GKR92_11185 [Gammaproteobacteria bacterium]
MSTKLTQKHLLKATHAFEIVEDQVNISIKSRFKQETHSVSLAVLNPEPVITRSHLEFLSRVNGEALLSLELSRPNVAEFNDFVNTLKQRALEEFNSIAGINVAAKPAALNGNLYEEPPEFDELTPADISKAKKVHVEGIENAINMLETYVNNEEIQPLLTALVSLKQAPQDHSKLVDVATVFNELGSSQGAVLTYAPYIGLMLSDDPFG